MSYKEEILKILLNSIKTFKNIDNYEMIGVFGSVLNHNENLGDLDLVSIGDIKTHKQFLKHMQLNFNKEGIDILFFKEIAKKPKINEKILLVHDLHYKNLDFLIKKEWKSVINSMKNNVQVLYGQNLFERVSLQKISKADFFNPCLKWARKIKSNNWYNHFESYLSNILGLIRKDGFSNEAIEIKQIIKSPYSWKSKLVKLKKIMSSH